MARSLTTKNLYQRKPGKMVDIRHPELQKLIGPAEQKGCWLVYGMEKNGKTLLALTLAKALGPGERVAYISAEEGLDKSFTDACLRAGITAGDRILWDEYAPIDDLVAKYKKPQAARIIILDNLTIYHDEIKPSELKKKLIDALPGKLIILVGHEERNLPFPAVARMANKLAKVVFHVKGLKVSVVSRHAPGGEMVLSEQKSELFWGDNEKEEKSDNQH